MKKFITDSKLQMSMDRLTDKDHAKQLAITDKWSVANNYQANTCGNIRVQFDKNGKAKLGDISSYKPGSDLIQSYEQISSPLALYRAVSIFQCGVQLGQDFYKMNWSVQLRHKTTGHVLTLGEWKGGFQIFTEAYKISEVDKTFKKDAESLLTLFVSDKVQIGYDGTVAGCVA